MDQYAGLDVALKETSIPARSTANGSGAGQVLVDKCLAQPKAVAGALRKHPPDMVLAVFETGPLAAWFHRKLAADGLPAGIDARHARAAPDTAQNKTGANGADGLALLGPGRFLPKGARQELRGDAGGAFALSDCGGARTDRRHLDQAFKPSSRRHENLRPRRSKGRRADFKDQCQNPARGAGGAGRDRIALGF